ncbi:MAG: Photosystem I reaction center subunit III [Cyanobacteria bacterium P01_D01_bin.73]
MRHLFTIALAALLWMGVMPAAKADYYNNLQTCGENPAFMQRAQAASTPKDIARFERYSTLMCGEEGLPHLIVDGNLKHLSEFVFPGLMFLYTAGFIGWSGRSYLQKIKSEKNVEELEIVINLPLAFRCALSALAWPVLAFRQTVNGRMAAGEHEVTVSPR